MKRVALFFLSFVFAFTVFSSPAYPAIPFLMSQNPNNSVAAAAIQMPLLVQVLRAAEHRFSITSKWYTRFDGFYATRKYTTGLFERINILTIHVFWNGSYGVYCSNVRKAVLFSDWESLLANQNDTKDPCK